MSCSKVILDTCIVSFLMKGKAEAERYISHVQGRVLAISFITVGEMYFGAEKRGWGVHKRQLLETTLRNFVIIPYDHEIARCYGKLVSDRQRAGMPIAPNDAWIAAWLRSPCSTSDHSQSKRFFVHQRFANHHRTIQCDLTVIPHSFKADTLFCSLAVFSAARSELVFMECRSG